MHHPSEDETQTSPSAKVFASSNDEGDSAEEEEEEEEEHMILHQQSPTVTPSQDDDDDATFPIGLKSGVYVCVCVSLVSELLGAFSVIYLDCH